MHINSTRTPTDGKVAALVARMHDLQSAATAATDRREEAFFALPADVRLAAVTATMPNGATARMTSAEEIAATFNAWADAASRADVVSEWAQRFLPQGEAIRLCLANRDMEEARAQYRAWIDAAREKAMEEFGQAEARARAACADAGVSALEDREGALEDQVSEVEQAIIDTPAAGFRDLLAKLDELEPDCRDPLAAQLLASIRRDILRMAGGD